MLHFIKPGVVNIQGTDASFNYVEHKSASHMERKRVYSISLKDKCTSNFQLLKSKLMAVAELIGLRCISGGFDF